jgi:hypothetical protein
VGFLQKRFAFFSEKFSAGQRTRRRNSTGSGSDLVFSEEPLPPAASSLPLPVLFLRVSQSRLF